MKIIWCSLITFAVSLLPPSIYAAEFSVSDNGIAIDGKIEVGDYDRFREFLLTDENILQFQNVWLNSPGGNVMEALKFANLFDKSFTQTWVGVKQKCYSSCFIMWAGGVERSVMALGEIGVHRISTRDVRLDIQKTKGMISPLATNVGNYLGELGIPRALIDKMNETPASSLFVIDASYINSRQWYYGLSYQPVYLDMVEKACGKDPDPYPGESMRDRPRDPQTMSRITEWVGCIKKIRIKNKIQFYQTDYVALETGKPTVLMTRSKLKEVRAIFQ